MLGIKATVLVLIVVLGLTVSLSSAEGGQAATPLTGQVFVAEQAFENGVMFWLQFTNQIWVLSADRDDQPVWWVFENTFKQGDPEIDPLILPPEDLMQPKRGFGAVWRDNLEVRDLLGWATEPEEGFLTNYTYTSGGAFDNEIYVPAPGVYEIFGHDGTVYFIDEATGAWDAVAPLE